MFRSIAKNQPKDEMPLRISIQEIHHTEEFDIRLGGFSIISKARWQHKSVIIKRLKYSDRNNFENEYTLQNQAKHPNIVRLLGIIDEQINNQLVLALVLEWMSQGDLYYYLMKNGGKGTGQQPLRKNMAQQALQAVAYLHSMNIIHRDIKTENLVLDDSLNVKLTDFGMAKQLPPGESNYYSKKIEGTVGWYDPDIAHEIKGSGYAYNKCTDVYSCGILLSVLFSDSHLPYSNMSTKEKLWIAVMNGETPFIAPTIPAATTKLLRLCWEKDIKKRPTVEEILNEVGAPLGAPKSGLRVDF